MTLGEKRAFIDKFCDDYFDEHNCENCPFNYEEAWCNVGEADDINDVAADRILTVIHEANRIKDSSKEDVVNHPNHYTHGMECIDEMLLVFGREATAYFCLCNAWKYRKRAIYKNGEEDMNKSDWYLKKYEELMTIDR